MPSTFTRLKRDCPICDGERDDCRSSGDLIHCRSSEDPPIGWRFVGIDTIGFGMYTEGRPDYQSKDDWKARNQERTSRREQERIEARAALPTLQERHDTLSSRPRRLTAAQNADLLRRGLTQDEIDGCLSRGWLWQERGGYGIAAIDPLTRSIVGGQKANDSRDPKYVWLLSGHTHLKETDQNPLAVWVSPDFDHSKPYTLNFCEGFLKPLVAALKSWRSDPQQVWVGAAGGNFEDLALARVLAGLPPSETAYLWPDAGSWMNPQVVGAYRRLVDLVERQGVAIGVRWWHQVAKADPDCDELERFSDVGYLQAKQFFGIAFSNCNDVQLRAWQRLQGLSATVTVDQRYLALDEAVTNRLLAIRSGLGTGKTEWTIGQLRQALAAGKRALILVPTNNLGENLRGRLAKAGIPSCHPRDWETATEGERLVLVCCPDSIATVPHHHLKGAIVVIDEAVAVRDAILTRVKGNHRGEVLRVLRDALGGASGAILLDGHMSDRVAEWYAGMTLLELLKIENTWKQEGYTEYLYLDGKAFQRELMEDDLDAPIAIASDARENLLSKAQEIEKSAEVKTRVLCSTTSYEKWVGDCLRDPAAFIERDQPSVFAFTPSAESGLDLSIDGYFGKVYGAFHGVIGVAAQQQILKRVRSNVDRHTYIPNKGLWDVEGAGAMGTTELIDEIRQMISQDAFNALEGRDRRNAMTDHFKAIADRWLAAESSQDVIQDAVIRNFERENLRACHIWASLQAGNKVVIVPGTATKLEAKSAEVSAHTAARKLQHAERVQSAPDCTDEEVEALKRKGSRTPDQQAICDRHYLQNRLPTITDGDSWKDAGFVATLLEHGTIAAVEAWWMYCNLEAAKTLRQNALQDWLLLDRIDIKGAKSKFSQLTAIKNAGFDTLLASEGFNAKSDAVKQFVWKLRKAATRHGLKLPGGRGSDVRVIRHVAKMMGLGLRHWKDGNGDRWYRIDHPYSSGQGAELLAAVDLKFQERLGKIDLGTMDGIESALDDTLDLNETRDREKLEPKQPKALPEADFQTALLAENSLYNHASNAVYSESEKNNPVEAAIAQISPTDPSDDGIEFTYEFCWEGDDSSHGLAELAC